MILSMHTVLTNADRHGSGIEGSEITKHYPWGETRRFGMRAWWNFDLTYEQTKAPVWPPVQEAAE